jgi:VWFA-related protein
VASPLALFPASTRKLPFVPHLQENSPGEVSVHQRLFFRSLSVFLLGGLAAWLPGLRAQTAVPDANGRLVFKANARIVVLDVVVAGRDGKPIQGLRKEDFSISEDGHPQTILSFDEHAAGDAMPAPLPSFPPNIFTNIPRVKPVDSVTVLLLDALNTPIENQSFVRAQMLRYLKTAPPGRRIAIFTLGTRLRFVQGFTDDPKVLAAALENLKNGANPRSSALLPTTAENDADQQSLGVLYQNFAANPSSVNLLSFQSVQQFQAEQLTFKTDARVDLTLEALQQLARYLAGIPGRKNLVWFSGGFPLNLFPNPDLQDSFVTERKYERQTQKTDALLGAAEIAIYPVAAEGAATDSLYSADQGFNGKINMQEAISASIVHPGQPQTQSLGEQAQNMETDSLRKDSVRRNGGHAMMDVIAADTGGEAFYNTNGIENAVSEVIDRSARFYTLTYTPANAAADGAYRKIRVEVAPAKAGEAVKLSYRRGYFATDPGSVDAAAAKPGNDPLHPFMGPGMPASTQILYALRIKPGPVPTALDPTPEMENHEAPVIGAYGKTQMVSHTDLVPGFENSQVARAGDNPRLKGKLTRYGVDFVIAASGLRLDPGANGSRHGSIESTLVAYDRQGRPLNWLVRQIDLSMDAAQYARVRENGINFHLDIDVPKDCVTLRSGVYDLASSLAGAFEVPVDAVLVGQAPGLKPR